MPILSANDHKSHWSKRAKIAKLWREAAKQEAEWRGIPHLDKVEITLWLYPRDNRRRDASNFLYFTSKFVVDGLVDAKVLTDDNDKVVRGLHLLPGEHCVKFGQVVLEIREVDLCGTGDWEDPRCPDCSRAGP